MEYFKTGYVSGNSDHTNFGITQEFIGELVDKHGTPLDKVILFEGTFQVWVNDVMHLGHMENPTLQDIVSALEERYSDIVEAWGHQEFANATFLGPYPIIGIDQSDFFNLKIYIQTVFDDYAPNHSLH